MNITKDDLTFDKTCFCCPEQYDVNYKGTPAGYIRLRWGHLTCEYPDVGGKLIYEAEIGDGWTGEFENEEQRQFHLDNCAEAIIMEMENEAI